MPTTEETVQAKARTRRNAMELTLHRLTQTNPETYEESAYAAIVRLCKPTGGGGVMDLAIHLADAMGAVLVHECGSKEAAAESLRQQLAEAAERSDR